MNKPSKVLDELEEIFATLIDNRRKDPESYLAWEFREEDLERYQQAIRQLRNGCVDLVSNRLTLDI